MSLLLGVLKLCSSITRADAPCDLCFIVVIAILFFLTGMPFICRQNFSTLLSGIHVYLGITMFLKGMGNAF